jgi:nucleotide-binding universal stress UspA family protein
MNRRILVPLDGSFASERILPWVVDHARRTEAHVDLLRVVPGPGLTLESEHEAGRARDDALRYLDLVAERLWKNGIHAELYVRPGSPVATIRDVARTNRADVILMATRGATSIRRGFYGSVTEQLLRQAPAPMGILHASTEFAPISRILTVIDRTRVSEMILPHAELFSDQILLAHTHPLTPSPRMEELCHTLKRRGIRAGSKAISGDPATTLLTLARRKRVGMIAMNSTDAHVLTRFFGRSLAEEIVRGSDVPVLVTFHRNYSPKPLYSMA